MKPVCFLFTSVGRRVELLRHFLDFANESVNKVHIIGTEIDRHSPAAQVLGDNIRVVPKTNSPEYLSALADLCTQEGVDAVFPLIDADVSVLANSAIPVAGLPGSMASTVSDKWLTYEWLRRSRIPTVRSWLPKSPDAYGLRYPLFMKPRAGSGAVDAFKINSVEEYAFFTRYIDEPIVQEFLPGPEITVDVVAGCDSRILATVQRRRLAVRGGEVVHAEITHDPTVELLAQTVATLMRPNGPITVQGMYDENGTFRITEINGRLGGGVPLSIAGGLHLARTLVESWSGGRPQQLSTSALDLGLRMVRYDQSLFYKA